MAKSATARKADQRRRLAESGVKKVELMLGDHELAIVEQNRVARRPGKEPYGLSEYIEMLIRQDAARVRTHFKRLAPRRCSKCGEQAPVASCVLQGDSDCWTTHGHHGLKINLS
jgi:phosphoribosyl-dephospho-CoA transferase